MSPVVPTVVRAHISTPDPGPASWSTGGWEHAEPGMLWTQLHAVQTHAQWTLGRFRSQILRGKWESSGLLCLNVLWRWVNFAWLVSKANGCFKEMRYKNGFESMRKCYRWLALKLENLKKWLQGYWCDDNIFFHLVLSWFEMFCQ